MIRGIPQLNEYITMHRKRGRRGGGREKGRKTGKQRGRRWTRDRERRRETLSMKERDGEGGRKLEEKERGLLNRR